MSSVQSTYSVQAGNGGNTAPHYLQQISDPMTKLNIAATRGAKRSALMTGLNQASVGVANVISGSNPMSSSMINSAGGTGITTSQSSEDRSQPMMMPSVSTL